jgi:hypothetical protein
LDLRLDLILAGQGIAKWPSLSSMKNAWSTVAYSTKLLEPIEKVTVEATLKDWVIKNQNKLQESSVDFDVKHLGSLAFRSNDFYAVKNVTFPISHKEEISPSNSESYSLSEEELRLTPKAGRKGIEPISGMRTPPIFQKENWNGFVNREVFVVHS